MLVYACIYLYICISCQFCFSGEPCVTHHLLCLPKIPLSSIQSERVKACPTAMQPGTSSVLISQCLAAVVVILFESALGQTQSTLPSEAHGAQSLQKVSLLFPLSFFGVCLSFKLWCSFPFCVKGFSISCKRNCTADKHQLWKGFLSNPREGTR